MNLLIVDDNPSVVEGLRAGIAWKTLGFTSVFTAYNALDAKAVLSRENVEIMLCDIQMPVESGLDLLMWINEKKLQVCTIFLTSYAEFEYAKRAIQLGGFDYIVQPAPYSEIFNAVKRAINDVHISDEYRRDAQLGHALQYQSQAVLANCILGFLRGCPNLQIYDTLVNYGLLPDKSKTVFPVLLHIQNWQPEEQWEPGLLDTAIGNILTELFAPYGVKPVLTSVERDVYAIVIASDNITEDIIEQQLLFLHSAFEQYFDCKVACYFDSCVPLGDISAAWDRLMLERHENIALNEGVFYVPKGKREPRVFREPIIWQWAALHREGRLRSLEESANALIDDMVEKGKMNSRSLLVFYLDFVGAFHDVISGRDNTIFNTPDKMEIYRNGMKTVENMRKLISLVAVELDNPTMDFDQKARVEQAICYINEHLDSDLKREDIASHVSLSPDYLTRIFKIETNVTIKSYIIRKKMEMARSMLKTTSLPVGFVAAKVGYSNFSHFSYTYKKEFGVTPQEERQGQ